jgi:DUF1365 family protein
MKSAIYHGIVKHRRLLPRQHFFTYRVFMLYLDLNELNQVFDSCWLWSARRWAPACFRRQDHFGDPLIPLDVAVRDLVEQETGQRPIGAIRLLTNLRYWGYVFNPVSYFYCLDPNSEHIEAVVAEVNNTPWAERHMYVLSAKNKITRKNEPPFSQRYQVAKCFHVSPFMPMDLNYEWCFTTPTEHLSVHMNLSKEEKIFDATLTLARQSITCFNLLRILIAYPFHTLKISIAIHWQAVLLWVKKIPFYSHPSKKSNNQST